MAAVRSVQSLSPDRLDDVLARDAIYAAVGRCRDHLSPAGEDDDRPSMDVLMGQAIAAKLVPEARVGSVASASWVVVRRRIAWLLWEWSEQVPRESRLDVYALLVELLEDVPQQTDVAVRLAAARSIAAIADALEFDADGFEPLLPKALRNLATLAAASDLHEMESIKVCTDALAILIERMGARIAPHADALVDLVPMLWQQDDPDCKARPSIIVFVSKVLRAIEMLPAEGTSGALMQKVHLMVAPIVRESLQPSVSHLLAKDAIGMVWIRALHSTPVMTQPLFELMALAKVLVVQPDYCVEMCRVVEEMAMLNPLELLQTYGADLLQAMGGIIADPSNPMVLAPISALDTLVQALVGLPNWNHVCGAWIDALESTRLVAAIVGALLHFADATLIATHFVALLCRIAFHCPDATFVRLVDAAWRDMDHRQVATPAAVWRPLLKLVCERFDNMASARKRRVTALGLASMLESAVVAYEQNPDAGVQEVIACVPEMIGCGARVLPNWPSPNHSIQASTTALLRRLHPWSSPMCFSTTMTTHGSRMFHREQQGRREQPLPMERSRLRSTSMWPACLRMPMHPSQQLRLLWPKWTRSCCPCSNRTSTNRPTPPQTHTHLRSEAQQRWMTRVGISERARVLQSRIS